MDAMRFDATAIASTGLVGGAISLPLPFAIGWLSDRIGRKSLLALCYAATGASLIVQLLSVSLWHFWAASGLAIALFASIGVGSALVTDLVPKEALGTALSWFSATNWIGFVMGLAGTGASTRIFGLPATLLFGVVLTVIALLLLMPVRQPARKSIASPLANTSENPAPIV